MTFTHPQGTRGALQPRGRLLAGRNRRVPTAAPASAVAWQRVTTASPGFARYQARTDRELPVIRLTPRS
ncbi:nitroreductase/quinone reductase family protein [Isoptericola sp. NPDC019482]|uniref:nitroreductase/quinone reductase family protein n=1 Tax=Isoptericola sp. NPDC019482 TaxID=3154688 RepID=UPI003497B648